MKKYFLIILFSSLLFLGLVVNESVQAQQDDDFRNCVSGGSIDGQDVFAFCRDQDACAKPRDENRDACGKKEQECVDSGGCKPGLATLSYMVCNECLAPGCYQIGEDEYKRCMFAAKKVYEQTPEPTTDVPPPSLSSGSSLLNTENTNNGDSPRDSIDTPQTTVGTRGGGSFDSTDGDQSEGPDPQAVEFARWMKECYNRPLLKTIAEMEQDQRDAQFPGHPCYSQLKPCEKAADGTCIPGSGVWTESDGGRSGQGGEAPEKEEQRDCQAEYNSCADLCLPIVKSNAGTEEFVNTASECKDKCYDIYRNESFHDCFTADLKCRYEIIERRDSNGKRTCTGMLELSCGDEIHKKCEPPYDACLKQANNIQESCLAGCMPTEIKEEISNNNCLGECETVRSSCAQNSKIESQRFGKDENPSVDGVQAGLSSLNFKELARANAEYQKAVADLEKIKQSDERWGEKQNIVDEYKAGVEKLIEKVPPSESDEVKKLLGIIKGGSETVRDLATVEIDLKTIYDYSLKKQMDAYGNVSLGADLGNTHNDYVELRGKGVSNKDAGGKALLDNFGTSAVTSIPVLKVIDVVAATPDNLLASVGVGEDNWSRKATGILAKFSPSGLISQTTELMLENQSLSDIDYTLRFAMGKVVAAEGVVATTKESVKFTFVVIGAGPVALARGITDLFGVTVFAGEKTVGFVTSLFTY